MPDRFAIESIGLVFGECDDLSTFLMKWLRGLPFDRHASKVTFVGDTPAPAHASRESMLARAAASQLRHSAPVVSWEDFRRRRFQDHERLIVVGATSSDDPDAPLDVGIALLVSLDGDGVSATLDADDSAWVAPVPKVPTGIESLFALAVSAACVLHGVQPGRLLVRLWDGRRAARVGSWTLARAAAPLPLSFSAPRLIVFRGQDRAAITERLKSGNEGGEGPASLVIVCAEHERENRLAEALAILETGRSFSEGIYYADHRLEGELAFVFPGLTGAYANVGSAWLTAVPEWRDAHPPARDDVASLVAETLWWQERAVAVLRESLGLHPQKTLGISVGEYFGRWAVDGDHEAAAALMNSDLFRRDIAGDFAALREFWANEGHVDAATAQTNLWEAWSVLGPLDTVLELVDHTDLVYVTEVLTDHECVIAGYPPAVEEVIAELLNSPKIHAEEIEGNLALHAPPVSPARSLAEKVFDPSSNEDSGTSLNEDSGTSLNEDSGTSPTDFLAHFDRRLDSRPIWKNAWRSGARIFIEVGPRGNVANCIDRMLGDTHDHLAVALDPRTKWGPREIFNIAARLMSVGLEPDLEALHALVKTDRRSRRTMPLPIDTPEARDTGGVAVAARALALQRELGEVHRAQLEAHTREFERYLESHVEGMKLAVRALSELGDR